MVVDARGRLVATAAVLGFAALAEIPQRHAVADALVPAVLLLGLCATAPVALLPRRPVWAAAAMTAATLPLLALFRWPPLAVLAAGAVALHALGRGRRPAVAGWFTLPYVAYAILGPPGGGQPGRLFALAVAAVAVAAAGTGIAARARRVSAARDASQAALTRTLLAYTARGERARIARELHDVVAHHISMIAVQAETARLTTPGLPPEGAERLLAIGDTARAALTEMRRLLGVLREDAGEPGAAPPTRAPQPGLRELVALLDEARDTGGAGVRLSVRGRIVPLDPGVQLTAYRIVQEALSNVRRHAPGAAADVDLEYTADALRVRVRDNGPGPAPAGPGAPGHGLLGMRERVGTLDGTLWAGPAPGGGFLVDALLPLPEPV